MRTAMLASTRWTEGCVVGACLREVRAQTGAELVLLTALTGGGTTFGYVVTLVRTDTGQVLQQISGRCDVCTVNEATSSATQAAVTLVASAPDALPEDPAGVGLRARQDLTVREQRTQRLAVGIAAVGAALFVSGVALYVGLDHPTYGAAAATGGLALGAAGVVVLTF